MTEMADWISTLLSALGGQEKTSLLSHWIVTKWNQDSKLNRQLCSNDLDNPLGTANILKKQKLGFAVVKHGEDYQDELFEAMEDRFSCRAGLANDAMDADVEHFAKMKQTIEGMKEEL